MPMPLAKSIATVSGRARWANSRTCAAYALETSAFSTEPQPDGGSWASISPTMRSMSFRPVAPEIGTAAARQSLQPFHSLVLCEAVIIAEPSAPSEALAK